MHSTTSITYTKKYVGNTQTGNVYLWGPNGCIHVEHFDCNPRRKQDPVIGTTFQEAYNRCKDIQRQYEPVFENSATNIESRFVDEMETDSPIGFIFQIDQCEPTPPDWPEIEDPFQDFEEPSLPNSHQDLIHININIAFERYHS
ncbi:hypothetical protein TVAG_121920 [Trichomonas vaginalis G3]|uniref:Uncharacterized protein n=1 Tax=Trichomonas vaginalis (strain ATCC PRA-98 / G3) TaxID=412133 RepID=A2E9A3_TRIV3|nr:hypothetical protein TVAGG3_0421270 [Trichomonas vaginalis G3]EAY10788.1 hypothetical protein TVAG_121920 [Trichomonas vaginalis G3]KAI5536072.1 hypothetical protein TVAGG3_0421270 [Trichomonas vaginalis G3]|eukprot:XP_001323011.1 hypothetical protein [Trichomonas vaginalis G3]